VDEYQQSLADLAGQVPKVTEDVRRIAREFGASPFEGSCADGRITATVTGLGVLSEVRIGETARRELDNLSLGDAVAEAIRAAEANSRAALRDQFAGLLIGRHSLADFLPADLEPDQG
jgi:DNA-binding protein YbaB